MIRSSFASFNTAKMAIQANQSALAIVGQNMANVKSLGYTRQRLDQISLNSKNPASTYMSSPDAYIGYGVMITGVSQIRDPFLDTRYRLEMSNLGGSDRKAELLNKLGMVFDETNRSGIDKQFSDLIKQFEGLNNDFSNSNENMVRSSAQSLCNLLRNYSNALDETKDYAVSGLENDVDNLNDLVKQIQHLNESIKNSQVHGNPALELQDQRNVLIDELATYADIRVSHTTDTTITGNGVDKLKIDYVDGNGTHINLIDDVKPAGSFKLEVDVDGKHVLTMTGSDGTTPSTTPSLKGVMQSALHMINDAGEFDATGAQKGIPYYKKVLDEIANVLATQMNALNNVKDASTADPNDLIAGAGDLFQTNDGTTKVTAANITLSDGWLNGTVHIQPTQTPDPNVSKDTSNIANMIKALTEKQSFNTEDGTTFFSGSLQQCFSNMTTVQSMEQKAEEATLDNYISITNEIANAKDSVSGVNLDEEAMNMMQFNSALTAASRYMTTLDEALNTVINNMGVVGR